MKHRIRIALFTATLAAAGITAGAAVAGGDSCRGPFGRNVQAMAESRLDKLHAELQLDAAQEEAWKVYRAHVARLAGKAGEKMRDWRDQPQSVKAVERLERGQQGLEAGRVALTELTEATRVFYATLTPAQQQRSDAATRRFGPHRHAFGA